MEMEDHNVVVMLVMESLRLACDFHREKPSTHQNVVEAAGDFLDFAIERLYEKQPEGTVLALYDGGKK